MTREALQEALETGRAGRGHGARAGKMGDEQNGVDDAMDVDPDQDHAHTARDKFAPDAVRELYDWLGAVSCGLGECDTYIGYRDYW